MSSTASGTGTGTGTGTSSPTYGGYTSSLSGYGTTTASSTIDSDAEFHGKLSRKVLKRFYRMTYALFVVDVGVIIVSFISQFTSTARSLGVFFLANILGLFVLAFGFYIHPTKCHAHKRIKSCNERDWSKRKELNHFNIFFLFIFGSTFIGSIMALWWSFTVKNRVENFCLDLDSGCTAETKRTWMLYGVLLSILSTLVFYTMFSMFARFIYEICHIMKGELMEHEHNSVDGFVWACQILIPPYTQWWNTWGCGKAPPEEKEWQSSINQLHEPSKARKVANDCCRLIGFLICVLSPILYVLQVVVSVADVSTLEDTLPRDNATEAAAARMFQDIINGW